MCVYRLVVNGPRKSEWASECCKARRKERASEVRFGSMGFPAHSERKSQMMMMEKMLIISEPLSITSTKFFFNATKTFPWIINLRKIWDKYNDVKSAFAMYFVVIFTCNFKTGLTVSESMQAVRLLSKESGTINATSGWCERRINPQRWNVLSLCRLHMQKRKNSHTNKRTSTKRQKGYVCMLIILTETCTGQKWKNSKSIEKAFCRRTNRHFKVGKKFKFFPWTPLFVVSIAFPMAEQRKLLYVFHSLDHHFHLSGAKSSAGIEALQHRNSNEYGSFWKDTSTHTEAALEATLQSAHGQILLQSTPCYALMHKRNKI